MDSDEIENVRPPTGELPPELWSQQLLESLDSEELVEEEAHADGIKDETGPFETMYTDDAGATHVQPAPVEAVAPVEPAAPIEAAAPVEVAAAVEAAAPVEETAPLEAAAPGEAAALPEHVEGETNEVPRHELESLIAESTPATEHAEAQLAVETVTAEPTIVATVAVEEPAVEPLLTDEPAIEPVPAEAPAVEAVEAVAAEPPAAELPHPYITAIAELLRAGRCVLVAGPRLAEPPMTIRDILARLVATLSSNDVAEVWPVLQARPLSAAGFVVRRLGDRFAGVLRSAVGHGGPIPDVTLRLSSLPFRAVVTTRCDDAFDRALATDENAIAVYTPRDGEALRRHGKAPFVLKLLGDPARPESLVWSHEALQAALGDSAFRTAAQELWRTRSFVFIGFQAGDVELSLITERLLSGAPVGDTEHFALLPGISAVEREELYAAWRINTLDEGEPESLARALTAALDDSGEELPADDDADGWLALYAADPARADAAACLDRIAVELREKGDHDALFELMLARVDIEPDPARRAETLLALSRVFEYEADDAARALTALLAAYKEDPRRAEWSAIVRLADAAGGWDDVAAELGGIAALPAAVRLLLHRKLERWKDVVRALDELAIQPDADVRALRVEAAEITAARLDDRAAAIGRFEELVAEMPGDLEVLRALDALYEDAGRQREYLENLARQADATDDRHERAALYRRLALSWEEEPDGALRAEQCWQTLLTIEPAAEDALRALERCYRAERRFPALIEALRRRAELSPPLLRAELYAEIGSIQAYELGDADRAIAAYLMAETADPTSEPTLAALIKLFDQTGAWHLCVERLVKRAKLQSNLSDALPLYFRAGELCAARLDDASQAESWMARVLEIDSQYVPALKALAELHKKNQAPLRAARLLVDAAVATPNHLERTQFLVEGADLYEEIDDDTRAIELYLEALAIDPEHIEAGGRVADLLWRAGRWGELVPVLEMLTRKPAEPELLLERLVRLARAARSAEQPEKAAKAWARAADLAPQSLAAQRGHADTLLAVDDWAGALQALERVFQYHIDALAPMDRGTLFTDLARCERNLGARESAREFVARALEHDPSNRVALMMQAELADDNPQSLIDAKRALIVGAAQHEQARLLDEIGDLYLSRLQDPERALGAWTDALEIHPDDHRLLHKSLDVFVDAQAWPQALETLERMIAVEKDLAVRAKYRHTAALLCRDELGRPAAAMLHLRGALDDDPNSERSIRALEQLYVSGAEWTELARLYRRRLKTLGPESAGDADGNNAERLRVWSALADLCMGALGDPESARAALEAVLVFDRDNVKRHGELADLYVEAGPDAVDKGIAEHQWVLRRDKARIASYRALKVLYKRKRQPSKSLACAYALAFLRKGDPEDEKAIATYKNRPFVTARRVMDEEAWARLQHPDEDRLIGQLLMLVGSTIAAGHAQSHKLIGLQRKDALAHDDPRSFVKALTYVVHTFDVAAPEAYERPEQREPVVFGNAVEGRTLVPLFQLGQPIVVDKRREAEQVFELSRKAALLRPERLLRLATPHPQQIAHVLDAAVALAYDAEGAAPSPQPELQRTAGGLKRALPPLQLEQVVAIGRKLRDDATRTEDAALAWLQAADLTALRAGLVMAGDLETSARLVAADGRPAGTRAPTERLLDMVWSSVTEEIFAVRRHLGL